MSSPTKGSESSVPDEVVRIFSAAEELEGEALAALLEQECAGRPVLRREVESLLAARSHGSEFLVPRTAADRELDGGRDGAPDEGAEAGALVGPYRLLEVLGHGGMGTVYRAAREEGGFEQQVALKLAHARFRAPSLDGEHPRAVGTNERFLRERQILARLEHPHIARLLDGGIAGDGSPYFAMELVCGVALDEACDRERFTVSERVAVMRDACRAVQFAHAQLVVHRDLKPSNMMLDSSGQLKLLDFGIAKLLDLESSDAGGELTRTGLSPHTPGYAAPEQLRGEQATVATDIYALGLILYELLTGRRPERQVLTGELIEQARPSSAVLRPWSEPTGDGTVERTPADVAAARSTTPKLLSRALRGDLEAIVHQALEGDPSQRYPTADAMAEDLQRYLRGLPVQARTATFRYRAGKLLRRHWAVAAASAVALVALLGGLGASLWQARVAAQERDRARLEAEKAREVQDLLVEVFSHADPNESRGEELTARELLERGLEKVRADEVTDPAVRATLLEAIARVLRTLGDFERMEEAAAEAVVLRRQLDPAGSVELAGALRLLASARYRQGEMPAAEEIHREAVELLRRLPDVPPLELASALNSLAVTLHDQFDYDEAEVAYREALELRQAELGEDDASVATSQGNLGLLLMDRGRYEEADHLLEQAQEALRVVYGDDHTTVATNLTFLGKNRRAMNDLEGAEEAFRSALGTYERLLGEEHPQVARTLASLANVAYDRGELSEAERLVRRSIALQRSSLGDHINVGAALLSLSNFLAAQGRHEEALEAADEAIAIRRSLGPGDLGVILATQNRGVLLRRMGRWAEARESFDAVIVALREQFGEDPRLADALGQKARLLGGLGDHEGAQELLRQALAILRRSAGDRHPSVGWTLVLLGESQLAAGDAEEGCRRVEEGLGLIEAALPEDDWGYGAALSARGTCLLELSGDRDEAERLLVRGHEIVERALGPYHEATVRAAGRLP